MIAQIRKLYLDCYPAATVLLPAALLIAVFLSGCLMTLLQPRVYESTARLWIQPKLPTGQESAENIYAPLAFSFTNALSTACELIKSESVLTDSVATLKKKSANGYSPGLAEIASGLSVVTAKNADVVIVSYRTKDPKTAMEVVSAVTDSFIKLNSQQTSGSATRSREFLQIQLDKARADDLAARNALKSFQDEHGAVNLDAQVQSLLAQESDKNKEIEDAKLAISQHQDKVDEIRSRLRISQEQIDAASKLAEDDVLKSLREEIAKLQVKIVEMAGKLRDEHPRVVIAKRKIQRLKAAMQVRARELAGESGVSLVANQLPLSDTNQQKQLDTMLDEESELRTEETHLARASSAVSAIREQLKTIPALQLRHVELARQGDTTAKQLSEAENTFREAQAKEYVATKNSNIQIIDYPSLPVVPIAPNIPMLIGLSLMIAIAGAAGLYFLLSNSLNPHISNISGIIDVLRFPLVGWVGATPQSMQLQEIVPAMQRLRVHWKNLHSNRIAVMSCDPGDGASTAAAGLALSFAQSGARVVLIDANFKHPQINEMFSLDPSPGLSDYLATENPDMLSRIIRTPLKGKQNLQVIPAGGRSDSAPTDSPVFQKLLQTLQAEVDVVILDTPAISQTADAISLLNSDTDLLFVSCLRHSLKNSLRLAAAELGRLNTRSSGVFLFGANEQDILATSNTGPSAKPTPAEAKVW